MFDAMKEKIQMDNAFVYNLSKPYQQYSQIELANEVWSHKGPEEIKVVINHNGKEYKLYTVGCNSAQDFLNKYHLLFNEIGLSYDVIKKEDVVNDQTFQSVVSEQPQISLEETNVQNVPVQEVEQVVEKKNDNGYEFFEFVVYQDTSYMDCFDKLLSDKAREKKDAKVKLNGFEFDTVGCNSIEDLLVKYSDYIFDELHKYQEHCLNNANIQEAIWLFKIPRGNKYDGTEENKQEIVSQIFQKENEWRVLFARKDKIDFNNSSEVLNWITTLIPYINTHALRLNAGVNDLEYKTMDNLLLAVLRENGYTSEEVKVNNIDDFYRQQVALKMKQLENYHFFVTEYSEMKEEDLSLTTQVVKDEAKLLRYKDRLEYCQNKLEELPQYEAGNINTKGGNFDKQIEILTNEIEELKLNQNSLDDTQKINEEISKSTYLVKKAIDDGMLDEISVKAGMKFLDAHSVPTLENIQEALTNALVLPGDSGLKSSIITGITNLARRYLKDEDEISLINEKLAIIGMSFDKPSINVEAEIQSRIQNIEILKSTKAKRIEDGKRIRPVIESEIEQLKNRIQKLNDKLGKETEKEVIPTQEELNVVLEEEKPFWVNPKLSELAQEGSIFVDESRIDPNHSYLSAANASNLGYMGDEISVQNEEEKVESNDVVDDNNEELDLVLSDEEIEKDSLFNFTVIESVKKITKPLYDKISSIDFKQKVNKAVEFLGKHIKPKVQGIMNYIKPVVVTSGLALGAAAAIALTNPVSDLSYEEDKKEESVDNNQEMGTIEEDIQNTLQENNDNLVSFDTPTNENNNDMVISPENTVQDENSVSVPELTPVFEDESQKAVDQALTGESPVYTNIFDAAQGTNVVEADRLYDASWQNGTPVNYYVVDDGTPELATKEEAIEKYNSGESVIQSVQNDGVTIGYVEFNNGQEQVSGMTK